MASSNPAKRAVAYTTYVSLGSQADADLFQTSVTLATGDVTLSKDGAAFANIATLPVEIGTTGVLALALSATEMTADTVVVRFRDAAGDQWKDLVLVLHTVANNFDDLATQASVNIIDDFLDTEVAAILVDTGTDIPALIDALPTAAEIWTSATRTLTSTAAAVAAAVSGSDLTITRAVTFSATITGLTISASWSKIYFTVKRSAGQLDADALIQIVETNPGAGTDGLLRLNGAAATAAQASLTVNQGAGSVIIALTDDATAALVAAYSSYVYDLKVYVAGDSSSTLLTSGGVTVASTATEAIS